MKWEYCVRYYYEKFINSVDADIEEYRRCLDEIYHSKFEFAKILDKNRFDIEEYLGLSFNDFYTELIEFKYNPEQKLFKVVKEIRKEDWGPELNKLLIYLLRFCILLNNEQKYKDMIRYAHKRRLIDYTTYRKYLSQFYKEVHRHLLNGEGVRFSNGLGVLRFDYTKINPIRKSGKPKIFIDAIKTKQNKEELISKGLIPYNKKAEIIYKKNNLEYKAYKYVAFTSLDAYYQLKFRFGKMWYGGLLDFQATNYFYWQLYDTYSKYDLLDYCKSFEDILNIRADAKVKLSLLLKVFPTYYIKFIRHDKKSYYKYRKNNSED